MRLKLKHCNFVANAANVGNRKCSRILQTPSVIYKFSDARESFTAKQQDEWEQYYFFSYILNFLEPKIFQYNFLEGHSV